MSKSFIRTIGAFALLAPWVLSPASGAAEHRPVTPGVTVTVAAAGDIARAGHPGTPQKQTAHLITSVIHPSRVLMLGDAQYKHGEYDQFMHSYDPTWGTFKNITDPVLGNHEYETAGAGGYFRYFAGQLAGRGSAASDPRAGNYSFEIGDWHIVALNSNCHFANCNAQATWLRNDMASDSHMCQLVMFHDPNQSSFLSAAAATRADLVLAGHEHRYERWDRIHGLNLRLLIVGTGGDSSGAPNPRADAEFKGYGVLQLDLAPTGYSWKFIDVGGRTRDSGSASCH